MTMKLVLASNNKGKLAELQTMLTPLGVQLIAQGELGVGEAEEPFHTFVENALAKARFASAHTGLPALADDAGLCIHAFGGLPGVQTAYYATQFGYEKGDANNVRALIEQMEGIDDRRAAGDVHPRIRQDLRRAAHRGEERPQPPRPLRTADAGADPHALAMRKRAACACVSRSLHGFHVQTIGHQAQAAMVLRPR
jgi:hypothetical protein